VGLTLALLVQGCLLPQDNQVLSPTPLYRNQVPRIVESTVLPGQVTTLRLGTNCTRTLFSAVVEDRDIADRIRTRWFVDPSNTFTGYVLGGKAADPSSMAARLPTSPPPDLYETISPLTVQGQHRLTLVISDGEFTDGINTLPRVRVLLDGGTFDEPTYTDSYTWFVTTDLSPCQ
jgi:hypothetical protein